MKSIQSIVLILIPWNDPCSYMSSTKKDIVKESTNQFKESTELYLQQQRQQYKDTASNLSQTTEKIIKRVNKFQEDNRRIFEKNADTFRKNQELINKTSQEISNNTIELQKDVFNTYQSSSAQFFDRRIFEKNADTFRKNQELINKTSQEISNNTIELQKDVFDTYQSSSAQFFDNINQSYWKNFNIPQRYSEIFNTINKNIQDYTVNATNFINEIAVGGVDNFNKSIELTQRYYNDIVQNNFNYARRIERSYTIDNK